MWTTVAFYQEIYRLVVPISFHFIFDVFQFLSGPYGGGTGVDISDDCRI